MNVIRRLTESTGAPHDIQRDGNSSKAPVGPYRHQQPSALLGLKPRQPSRLPRAVIPSERIAPTSYAAAAIPLVPLAVTGASVCTGISGFGSQSPLPLHLVAFTTTTAAFVVATVLDDAARANSAYDLENSPQGAVVTQTLVRLLNTLPNEERRDAARQYLARKWDSLLAPLSDVERRLEKFDSLRTTVFKLHSPDLNTSWKAASTLARDVHLNEMLGFETKPFNNIDKGRAIEILDQLVGHRNVGADEKNEVLNDFEYQQAAEQFNAATDDFRSPAMLSWIEHSPHRCGLPVSTGDTDPAVLLVVAALTRIGVRSSQYMHALPEALKEIDDRDDL